MKKLIIPIFFLLNVIVSGYSAKETNALTYYTVSEVDSTVYVTTSQGLLILQLDYLNNPKFRNMMPGVIRGTSFRSAANNNHLLISSTDTLYLFSIAERQNPVLLDKIFKSGISSIKEFGNKFILEVNGSELITTENGKVKSLITGLPSSLCSYPYVFSKKNKIIFSEYLEDENRFDVIDSLALPDDGRDFMGMCVSSSYLYFYKSKIEGAPPFFSFNGRMYIYGIDRKLSYLKPMGYINRNVRYYSPFQMNDRYIQLDLGLATHLTLSLYSMTTTLPYDAANTYLCNRNIYTTGSKLYYSQVDSSSRIVKIGFREYDNTSSVKNELKMEKEYHLNQNYPNPFNPSTVISFNLSRAAHTSLKVYDILGREIKTLVNGYMESGSHTVNFDASDIPAGVYIYTLQSGNSSLNRKMTLMK